ncbi:MAG: SufD family Fe-S cluster assembly protein [Oscillospiraceae bacterium]|jgi:FeS assembly protein SufD|nr:SufD family Fe-S cluster assembly protein [Oscillospiraceae bacterium]
MTGGRDDTMNLELAQINTLPAPTWFRLAMNDTKLSGGIPEIHPYQGDYLSTELPRNVEILTEPFSAPELSTGMGGEAEKFTQDHRTCGVTVRVPDGVKADKPIFLSFRVDEENPSVLDVHNVIAGEGSEVTVVMSYTSPADFSGFHGGMTRLYAAKNAVIRLIQVQLLGDGCVHYDNVGAQCGENGTVTVIQAELGGKSALAGLKADLQGRKSQLNLDTIYFGDRSRSIDINYVAHHAGSASHSEIHASGALLDESRKTFRGTIDFLKGAKRAVGHESEYSLLFSPKVVNRSAPLILCAEEDVEGQHAASAGKIDANRMFYLMSRGLSELEARKLLIEAQFRPVTDRIPDPALRDAVLNYVKERLEAIEPVSE